MASDVQVKFGGDFNELKQSLAAMEGHVQSWGSNIRTIAVGAFGVFAGRELIQAGVGFVNAAREAAEVDAKLAAVLEATGHAAGFTADELEKMAKGLQSITKFDDDVIKGAQTILATFTNIRTDEFQRAIELAADMATIMGGDVKSAAEQLGKALDAPIQGIMLLGRSGVKFTEQQQEMIEAMVRSGDVIGAQNAIMDKLASKVGGAAEAAGSAAGGGFAEFDHVVNDIKEAIGGGLLVVIDELLPKLVDGADLVLEWAESFEAMGPAIADSVSLWMGRLESAGELAGAVFGFMFDIGAEAFTGLQKLAVGMFTAFDVGWKNLPGIASLAWDSVHLAAVTVFEDLTFFFTDTAPTLFNFFADNWREIFTDIANFTGTVLENMFDNVETFFKAVWEWLNGNEASFEFKALTEGFEASLKELPKIAERELTGLEKTLQGKIGLQAAGILGNFQSELEKNLAAAGLSDVNRPSGRAPKAEGAAATKRERENFAPKESGGDKDKEFKSEFEDLGSLFKRIQSSAASGGSPELKAAEKTAEATEKTAAAAEETKNTNKEIAAEMRAFNARVNFGGNPALG